MPIDDMAGRIEGVKGARYHIMPAPVNQESVLENSMDGTIRYKKMPPTRTQLVQYLYPFRTTGTPYYIVLWQCDLTQKATTGESVTGTLPYFGRGTLNADER